MNKITLTADVIITYDDGSIVLIKRGTEPFKGKWALPGGRLDGNETLEETAIREAKEETGLDVQLNNIVGVYSDPNRDPRGRYVSAVFTATPVSGELHASSDAAEYLRTKDFTTLDLAFDHDKVIADYLETLK